MEGQLKLGIQLNRFSNEQIVELCDFGKWIAEQESLVLARWLCEQLLLELQRRRTEGAEPGMLEIPAWNAQQIGEALYGSLLFLGTDPPQPFESFAYELHGSIASLAIAALGSVPDVSASEG